MACYNGFIKDSVMREYLEICNFGVVLDRFPRRKTTQKRGYMRIGKGMRKVVSWLLTGALVVTEASGIGAVKAKAHSTLQWTGELYMGIGWGWTDDVSVGITPSVTNEDSTLELTALDWNDVGVGLEVTDIADFTDPWITVVATETEDGEAREFAVTDSNWEITYAGVNGIDNPDTEELEDVIAYDVTTISGALDKEVTNYNITAQGRTITAVYVHEKEIEPITGATIEPSESVVPETQEPVYTSKPEATSEPDVELQGTTLKWTGELEMGIGWGWTGDYVSDGITPSVTDEDSTLELNALIWNDVGVNLGVADIANFAEPWITVIATETTDGGAYEFAVTDDSWEEVYAGANCNEDTEDVDAVPVGASTTAITGALDRDVTSYNITAQGRTITAVYVHG